MKNVSRYIALFFLAAYLTAAGGRLWMILSCPCVALHEHTEVCLHHGHHHAHHHGCCTPTADRTKSGLAVEAPCCNHHHAADNTLYTSDSDDKRDRVLRTLAVERSSAAVIVTPPDLQAACSERSLRHCDRPAPPPAVGHRLAAGLRAPPITA